MKRDITRKFSREYSLIKEYGDVLTKAQCKDILVRCNVIIKGAPHQERDGITVGSLVVGQDQPMFVDQKNEYYCSIVCSTDCICIQISYQISKKVISLISNNQQRPFIQSLLYKFPCLKYFQAKQYVTKQYMLITQFPSMPTTQTQTLSQNKDQLENMYENQQEFLFKEKERDRDREVIRDEGNGDAKLCRMMNCARFQILWTGDLYLVVSGSVSLLIDQITQRKPSTLENYVISQKSTIKKQILQLFANDVFGFEQIGQAKGSNLRYLVTVGSKILKINQDVFDVHLYSLPGFREDVDAIILQRNMLVNDILARLQENLEIQQIHRHKLIKNAKPQQKSSQLHPKIMSQLLPTSLKQINHLKYLSHQDYESMNTKIQQHFSPLRENIPKRSLSPDIIKEHGLGLEFANNVLTKATESIQIKDGWIQFRDATGRLLRKKKLKDSSEKKGGGDPLLRKLGILNSKEIADHNYSIIKNRPSKYKFEDFTKKKNQFQAIRQRASSLPKLTNFFAKKEDRKFNVLFKKSYL